MKNLRQYQIEADNAAFEYFAKHAGNPLIVAPVAAGKSLLIAQFIKRALSLYPSTKFLMLSHVAELLTQDAKELKEHAPEVGYCFYSAQLNEKRLDATVIFGGIQSIHDQAFNIPHAIDVVIIDEAHLLSPKETTTYRKLLNNLLKINPQLKVIGYTGTPYRMGQGYLHRGEDALFTDVAFNISMTRLIEEGYLCPAITPPMNTQMDVSRVGKIGGDFKIGELEAAIDKDYITKACVDEIVQHGVFRNKWLVFCAGVDHATHTRDELRSRGVSCEMLDGKVDKTTRKRMLAAYEAGKIKCMVNVATMTTGLNIPAIDLIAFMRPTRSPVLYTQCVGRGMRLSPNTNKKDCLVLDFGGIIDSLGPVDKVRVKEPKQKLKPGEAPTKVCPECLAVAYAGQRVCVCGFEFPDLGKSNIQHKASNSAILSSQIKDEWAEVYGWSFGTHKKEGKPDSLIVTYDLGMTEQKEWILLEHGGYAQDKAVRWWRDHGGLNPVPVSVVEGLGRISELKKPTHISVGMDGKFSVVRGFKL